MGSIDIITDPRFIKLLSTYGLAVVRVLYIFFWRDPKRDKYWRERYDELVGNYNSLSKSYDIIESNLIPEKREISHEQAKGLANIGLDRDLYKLYYFMRGKLEDRRPESMGTFIAESIRDTNDVWSNFVSPFPNVERIGDLFAIYTNSGESLRLKLEEVLQEDIPIEKKESKILNLLFENTENMKTEFQGLIKRLDEHKEVKPYKERAVAAKN